MKWRAEYLGTAILYWATETSGSNLNSHTLVHILRHTPAICGWLRSLYTVLIAGLPQSLLLHVWFSHLLLKDSTNSHSLGLSDTEGIILDAGRGLAVWWWNTQALKHRNKFVCYVMLTQLPSHYMPVGNIVPKLTLKMTMLRSWCKTNFTLNGSNGLFTEVWTMVREQRLVGHAETYRTKEFQVKGRKEYYLILVRPGILEEKSS